MRWDAAAWTERANQEREMNWKKGDRVQANYKGDVVHGVVTRSTAKKTSVLLDDAVTILTGSPALFRLSNKPMPEGLRQAMPVTLKKGTRVEFHDQDGTFKTGVVQSGGAKVKVVLDGGKYQVTGPAHLFTVSEKPLPKDPPHPMDDWGIVGYRTAGGEETVKFEATITYKGQKVLHASNDGIGGPNRYDPLRGVDRTIMQKFVADAKQWAADHGAENPFEPEDSWVSWKTAEAPYGVTAQQHWDEYNSLFEEKSHLSNKVPKP